MVYLLRSSTIFFSLVLVVLKMLKANVAPKYVTPKKRATGNAMQAAIMNKPHRKTLTMVNNVPVTKRYQIIFR